MANKPRLRPSDYAGQAHSVFLEGISSLPGVTKWSLGVFLLCLDQTLKYMARQWPTHTAYFSKPWFGWEYFANPGIAFSLPLPNSILLILTPIILCMLVLGLLRSVRNPSNPRHSLALILIITGALSNFIDRVLFAVTIDYLRLWTSVINLGDIAIVIGALLLMSSWPKKERLIV